jgi:hypothetical protein
MDFHIQADPELPSAPLHRNASPERNDPNWQCRDFPPEPSGEELTEVPARSIEQCRFFWGLVAEQRLQRFSLVVCLR